MLSIFSVYKPPLGFLVLSTTTPLLEVCHC